MVDEPDALGALLSAAIGALAALGVIAALFGGYMAWSLWLTRNDTGGGFD